MSVTISVPEYFEHNRRYFNETRDCALTQVRESTDEPWMDYARSPIDQAEWELRRRKRAGEGDRWRVVDWIDRNVIDFTKDLPSQTEPYTAMNGHRMVAPIQGWDYFRAHDDGQGPHAKSTSWNARCIDACRACGAGEALPDW